MSKKKHDWNKLKVEFFNFDGDLSDFQRLKIGSKTPSGTWITGTKGWKKERDEARKIEAEKAIKSQSEKRSRQLATTLNNLITVVSSKFSGKIDELKKMDSKTLRVCYDIVKNELGQPTRVIRNDNFNRDVPNSEALKEQIEDAKKKFEEEGLV